MIGNKKRKASNDFQKRDAIWPVYRDDSTIARPSAEFVRITAIGCNRYLKMGVLRSGKFGLAVNPPASAGRGGPATSANSIEDCAGEKGTIPKRLDGGAAQSYRRRRSMCCRKKESVSRSKFFVSRVETQPRCKRDVVQ